MVGAQLTSICHVPHPMKILLLAPHPFYQERGSPIAVNLLLQLLADRGDNVDALVYHEGEDVSYANVNLHRIPNLRVINDVPPGFSGKKLICDVLMVYSIIRLMLRNRYDLVYCVEESVFMALLLKWMFRIPYAYDMDSRLSEQLRERYGFLAPLTPLMRKLEGVAIRNSLAVVPVCDNLFRAEELSDNCHVVQLRDVALLSSAGDPSQEQPALNLKQELGLDDELLLLYVGNLAPYQGIDLMLEAFALASSRKQNLHLAIVGGASDDIAKYTQRAAELGIAKQVSFTGPRPLSELGANLAQADILLSPRSLGSNTPMKLYSYLASGVATVATDLPTHTQVATPDTALLVAPEPGEMAEGIQRLANDPDLRKRLGSQARQRMERHHSPTAFKNTANELFAWLELQIARVQPHIAAPEKKSAGSTRV